MPKVSVVIPTHNRAELLPNAISSVLRQTFPDFEVLIIDDASTDNTAEVVARFSDPRIRYIRHSTNWRVSAARNTAVVNSRGSYIAFLDDDDEWLPAKLEKQVTLLEDCAPVVGGVYTGVLWVSRPSGQLLATRTPSKRGHVLHELCKRNLIGTASNVMLRRECFDEVGLFDETIDFGEEYDMWIRVAHAFDFTYVPEPLVRYSVHAQRLSTNHASMIRGLERQLRKHGEFFALSPENLNRRYVTLGFLYCYQGELRRGRSAFRSAIRSWPLGLNQYAYLALSSFGSRIFQSVMRSSGRT